MKKFENIVNVIARSVDNRDVAISLIKKSMDKESLFTRAACFRRLPRLRLAITFSALVLVFCLGVVSESWAATTCAWAKNANGNDTTKLVVSGSGEMSSTSNCPSGWKNTATEIEIEEGVTTISASAFQSASKVTKVTIPNSVTSIGAYAFAEMRRVGDLRIPEVVNIGSGAFAFMRNLTSLTISDNVNTTFWGVSALGDMPTYTNIICLGSKETCYDKLSKYFTDGDPNCPENENCNCIGNGCFDSNRIHEANAMQCNASGIYYFTGSECIKRPAKETEITCDHETKGYVKVGNYCVAPEDSYAKKRYTPAEAAQWLNEDNNTITLTFKKR